MIYFGNIFGGGFPVRNYRSDLHVHGGSQIQDAENNPRSLSLICLLKSVVVMGTGKYCNPFITLNLKRLGKQNCDGIPIVL